MGNSVPMFEQNVQYVILPRIFVKGYKRNVRPEKNEDLKEGKFYINLVPKNGTKGATIYRTYETDLILLKHPKMFNHVWHYSPDLFIDKLVDAGSWSIISEYLTGDLKYWKNEFVKARLELDDLVREANRLVNKKDPKLRVMDSKGTETKNLFKYQEYKEELFYDKFKAVIEYQVKKNYPYFYIWLRNVPWHDTVIDRVLFIINRKEHDDKIEEFKRKERNAKIQDNHTSSHTRLERRLMGFYDNKS